MVISTPAARRATALRKGHRAASPFYGNGLFQSYLRCIPLLWVCGVLTPAGALMLLKLVADRWPQGFMINAVIWSWFSIGLVQAFAALMNGIAIHNIGEGVANMLGFGVVGWMFGGCAIAAGASYQLDDAKSIRSITWVGGFIVILAALTVLARQAGRESLWVQTPVEMLLPLSRSVTFYTTAFVFGPEETLGETTTRLILFFPWTAGLGLGGLAITFVSVLEQSLWWRLIGCAGGLIGVVFSWSRIAIASLIAISSLLFILRLPLTWRIILCWVAITSIIVLPIAGINPLDLPSQLQDKANEARAGSSMARELIYEKSWEGFLESPIIGHGWIGESVHETQTLPIGSHSTTYGLLYTGGFPTLAAFIMAMLLTFAALIRRFNSLDAGDPRCRHILMALGLTLCLATFCSYESLFNLTLPCLYLFTWIGASIGCDKTSVRGKLCTATRTIRTSAVSSDLYPGTSSATTPSHQEAVIKGPGDLRRTTHSMFQEL